ncbi:hypothetical protein J6590_039410 [Homalodisca vitripennis]|nr:hypothetical protein J6590_039410 [Homalodisca vitripennis]
MSHKKLLKRLRRVLKSKRGSKSESPVWGAEGGWACIITMTGLCLSDGYAFCPTSLPLRHRRLLFCAVAIDRHVRSGSVLDSFQSYCDVVEVASTYAFCPTSLPLHHRRLLFCAFAIDLNREIVRLTLFLPVKTQRPHIYINEYLLSAMLLRRGLFVMKTWSSLCHTRVVFEMYERMLSQTGNTNWEVSGTTIGCRNIRARTRATFLGDNGRADEIIGKSVTVLAALRLLLARLASDLRPARQLNTQSTAICRHSAAVQTRQGGQP